MYTATTPELTFEIEENLDLADATKIWITFTDMDDNVLLQKDVTIAEGNTVSVLLTQKETLDFPLGIILAQINYLYMDGPVERRSATDKVELEVFKNSDNKVVSI